MKKSPSNIILMVAFGIAAIIGIYIFGALVLKIRREADSDINDAWRINPNEYIAQGSTLKSDRLISIL
ncbi:MAG: hypothetical protein LDL41_18745 [Coleofasciculus sp. S288]|nr:hypothetical protein [Coleofasciculus sp. S288]